MRAIDCFMYGFLGAFTCIGLTLGAFVWPVFTAKRRASSGGKNEDSSFVCGQDCPVAKSYRNMVPYLEYYGTLVGTYIGVAVAAVVMIAIATIGVKIFTLIH